MSIQNVSAIAGFTMLMVALLALTIAFFAVVWQRDKAERRLRELEDERNHKRKNADTHITYLSSGMATPDIMSLYRASRRVSDDVPEEKPEPFSTHISRK